LNTNAFKMMEVSFL